MTETQFLDRKLKDIAEKAADDIARAINKTNTHFAKAQALSNSRRWVQIEFTYKEEFGNALVRMSAFALQHCVDNDRSRSLARTAVQSTGNDLLERLVADWERRLINSAPFGDMYGAPSRRADKVYEMRGSMEESLKDALLDIDRGYSGTQQIYRKKSPWRSIQEAIEGAIAQIIIGVIITVAGGVIGGVIVAYDPLGFQTDQQVKADLNRAWQIAADARQPEVGNIGQKWALEMLHIHGADIENIAMPGALLRHAELRGAKLARAQLTGAVLEHADLTGADLWRANFANAFLDRANLTNARLTGAFLMGAQLDDAELSGAVLENTDLSGADLRGASVTSEQLNLACAEPASPPKLDEGVKPTEPWPQKCPPWRE